MSHKRVALQKIFEVTLLLTEGNSLSAEKAVTAFGNANSLSVTFLMLSGKKMLV